MTKTKVFLIRSKEENIKNDKLNFLEYVWNEHCIYYSHEDRNHLYFYRIRSEREESPTLSLEKNSTMIKKIEDNKDYEYLLYSYKNFCSAYNIKDIKDNKTEEKLKNALNKVQEKFYKKTMKRQYVFLTNEGAGKSKIVLDQIKGGEIYTAPDREILKEKERYLTSLGKKFIRFYSNADIIYTVALKNRNKNFAEEISRSYIEDCKHFDKNIDKEELSRELEKLNKKNTQYILKELNKISDENKIEYDKENSSLSLISFLKNNDDLSDFEKESIISYYNYLLYKLINGEDIITCTTHKLKILLQKTKYERKLLIYCDEIVDDIHGNAMVLNKNVIHDSTYNFISHNTTLKERGMELNDKLKEKENKLKKNREIKEWYKIASYFNYNSLVEVRDNKWMKNNDAYFVILTTEEKAFVIFPEAKFFDFRHKIYEDNINIICIDNFNSTNKEDKIFRGNERPLIVKACAETIFNIKSKYYIGNGVGHSLENNLPNTYNVRGTNNMFISLREEKENKNIGIAIKSPHPESINLHKGLYYANQENIDFSSVLKYSEEIEPYMISVIVNDQFHQCVGRANGYRKIEGVKTYIFITSQLLSSLRPCYITKNVFHLTNFLNQKIMRDEHPDISKFLMSANILLNLKKKKYENVDIDDNFYNHLKNLIEDINLKKYINFSIDFLNNITMKFVSLYKFYLNRLKDNINKIKYIFSEIKELRLTHMEYLKKLISRQTKHLYKFIIESKILKENGTKNHQNESEGDSSNIFLSRSDEKLDLKLESLSF